MTSSANNKTIAKNTVMLYIRMVILMLVNLYTSRIVLQALGVEDYGLYSVVGAVVIFLGFINQSMTAASQRFLSYYKGIGEEQELNSTFNSICVVQLLISLIILAIGETAGIFYIENYLNVDKSKIYEAHIVYQLSLISLILKTLTVPYNASITANERMNAFAMISVAEALCQLAVVFILQNLTDNKLIKYAILMTVCVGVVQACFITYSRIHFKECRLHKNYKKSKIKEIFSYSGWNLLGALVSVGVNQGGAMILNSFFGVVVNAAKGLSNQVGGAIASLSGSFQNSTYPQIVKAYAEKDMDRMYKLTSSVSKFSFYLLLIISLPVIFNMNSLLKIWLVDVPPYAEWLCVLMIINYQISSLSNPLMFAVSATGNIKNYQIIISSINLINIPASIIGLYIYKDPYLTMYIMIFVTILMLIGRLIMVHRMIGLGIDIFIKKAIAPTAVTTINSTILAYIICHLIADTNILTLAARMTIIFGITIASIYTIGTTKAEKLTMKNWIIEKIRH